jgi:nucleotide-binding universal stress UspA family protein
MYKRILVAVDGSETAERALREGVALAEAHRARLRLVHVVDELTAAGDTPATPVEFWKAVRKAGSLILEGARAHAAKAGMEAETKLAENRTFGGVVRRVPNLIVEDARRWKADLIVIGTHGRRGLSKLLLGSVADGVVRTSATSVLLVRGAVRKTRRAR